MIKKKGGTIKNWQTHTLAAADDELMPKYKEAYPEMTEDKAMVFTGTVVDDPTGRWQPGFHMRSSLIMTLDREAGVCETQNTVYFLEGEEGGDMFEDMGRGVLSLFY
jgi:hypothetical protein